MEAQLSPNAAARRGRKKTNRRWTYENAENAVNGDATLVGRGSKEPTALAKWLALTGRTASLRLKVRRAVVYRSSAARRVLRPNKVSSRMSIYPLLRLQLRSGASPHQRPSPFLARSLRSRRFLGIRNGASRVENTSSGARLRSPGL